MTQQEMKKRTKEYAKRIIKLCRALPDGPENRRISDQLFRAGTCGDLSFQCKYIQTFKVADGSLNLPILTLQSEISNLQSEILL